MTGWFETIQLWQQGWQRRQRGHAAARLGLGPGVTGSPDDFPDLADEFGYPLLWHAATPVRRRCS